MYQISATPDHKTVIIDYDGNVGFIPALEDGSTADSYGNIYKFISVRLASMDNVNDLIDFENYTDKNDAMEQPGDKVFADADRRELLHGFGTKMIFSGCLLIIVSPMIVTCICKSVSL